VCPPPHPLGGLWIAGRASCRVPKGLS
jgi:hypothetical protein